MNAQNQVKVIAWRKPTGYSRYEVSNADNPQIIDTKTGRVMHQSKMTGDGNNTYNMVRVMGDDGKWHSVGVHRMVALAHIPNPNHYPVVDHMNDNPQDNRAENLHWVTHRYNHTKPAAKAKASRSQLAAARRPEVRENRIRAQQRRRMNERFAKVAKFALDEIRENIEMALIQAEDSLGVLDQQIFDMEVD